MATFKRLTVLDGDTIFVNLDLVQSLWRETTDVNNDRPEHTRVWFQSQDGTLDTADYLNVKETPEAILA
jgi:hypothetical protein